MAEGAVLVVRTNAPYLRFCRFVARASGIGGRLVAARGVHQIVTLEPGTLPLHTWIMAFPDLGAAGTAWEKLDVTDIRAPSPPLVIAAQCVPSGGYGPEMAFVPTRSNVDPGPAQPPTLMLIEGSATDQDRMDRYRDIILPMMRERNGYYSVFELGGAVNTLSGTWDEAIFAISRWSGPDGPLSFWNSARYQDQAIPLRLDIGKFQVVMFEGERDRD